MNDTGRLPHFGLYHVGMEVRLTQTLAAPHVVVDCIGVIRGFKFAPEDEGRGDLNSSFVVLRRLPEAIYVQLQDVEQKFLAARTKWSVCGSSLQQQSCLVTDSEATCFAWWRLGRSDGKGPSHADAFGDSQS